MKKAKKKQKKLSREQDSSGGVGSNLKSAGTVLVAALIGEIVEATVERLLQRVAPGSDDRKDAPVESNISESALTEPHASHEDGEPSVLAESPPPSSNLLANLGHLSRHPIDTVKSAVREAIPHVMDSVKHSAQGAIEPLIDPLVDRLEVVATQPPLQEAVRQAIDGVANLAEGAGEGDSPKKVSGSSKKGKKGKRKGK